jgi:hypothetical protein
MKGITPTQEPYIIPGEERHHLSNDGVRFNLKLSNSLIDPLSKHLQMSSAGYKARRRFHAGVWRPNLSCMGRSRVGIIITMASQSIVFMSAI